MNRTIKITTASGLVIELADVDQLFAVMPLFMEGVGTATVQIATGEPMQQQPPTAPADLGMLPMDVAPARKRRQPDKCYLTKTELPAMDLLLAHPKGITSADVAKRLGVTHSAAASTLNRIRTHRPYEDTTEPIITRVSNGLYRPTTLGANLTYLVGDRPAVKMNHKIGWGQ